MHIPSYINLLKTGELERRVKILNNMLKDCILCPHNCHVNRLKDEKGYCRALKNAYTSGAERHFGEEPELVGKNGSGTIFFSYCNLRCVFCQNYEISHCGIGQEATPYELALSMLQLQKQGCHNINLVSPNHIIPQIVEAIFIAAQNGLCIPIIYNTNGYDSVDSIKLLSNIIDIYMPDIKFSNNKLGEKYLKVKEYYTITKEAIKEMYRQVGNLKTYNNIAYRGLIIRHLVMPNHIDNTKEIMQFVAQELSPDVYVNLMSQYYPVYRAKDYPMIDERLTQSQFRLAKESAKEVGLINLH
ncbi:radical SAM protein [Serpentinicella alkaliphila]|uniref:Putative pyruvate formate lyase activating enzyme n=1 Tax=Serpentinicella alkaliphila TaxID=1734049 RepID=A0A4R2T5T7_9FIRM|nr:radical SAM protein [Serpentinicella alkaliphila]QUH25597.1 radical SAM protein [Serpentinicella alkaliphila]TCP98377.1 putative pyruvate formate lyase activating enzyme [Serpentinicella alkaliphila]